MTNKARTLFFAAMLAMAALPIFFGGDPSPKSMIVIADDDPTPADPFCPESTPPPCTK